MSRKKSNPLKKSKKSGKSKKDFVFGTIKKQSFDKLMGTERGSIIKVYGLVCNCDMYSSDPYNCSSTGCDSHCA